MCGRVGRTIATAAAVGVASYFAAPLLAGAGTTSFAGASLGGGITAFAPPAGAASGGLFASAGSFLSSPGFSAFTQVAGFGIRVAGANQQAKLLQAQYAFREAELRNQRIIANFNILQEQKNQVLRNNAIGNAGKKLQGQQVVTAAALGQLVGVGSAADITAETAGDTAFKKLLSQHESDMKIRNLNIGISSTTAQIGATQLAASGASDANIINQFGGALTTASSLSRRFTTNNGKLGFRTGFA